MFLLALGAVATDAQEPAGQAQRPIESIDVVGSRLGTDSYTRTVVDSDTLRAMQPLDALEALRAVPGLHVQQPAGRAGPTSLFLRGADPNLTLIMINGIPLNDPTNSRGGSFDVSSLDVRAFERIEIIRGASSAVYGSDALAGVINFVTPGVGAARQITGYASIGTDEQHTVGGSLRFPVLDSGGLLLSASRADQGDIAREASFEGGNFMVSGRVQPHRSIGLSFLARAASGDSASFPEDSGGPELAVMKGRDARDYRERVAGVSADLELSAAAISVGVQGYERDEALRSPGVAPGLRDPFGVPANTSDSAYERTSLISTAERSIGEAVDLLVGAEWREESGVADSTLALPGQLIEGQFALQRTTRSAFLEGHWKAAAHPYGVDWSLRWDAPDASSTELSSRLALRIPEGPFGAGWHLSFSEGFKLPSFFALGNPIVGNPDLRPETSESFELGGSRVFGASHRLEWSLFSTSYRNLVDVEDGPPLRLVNRTQVDTQGIEISYRTSLGEHVELEAWIAHLDADIVGTDSELRQRPDRLAGAQAHWRISDRTQLSVLATHTGPRYDSSIPTGRQLLEAYERFRVSISQQILPAAKLVFELDNLTDDVYESAIGFPAVGRQVNVGIVFDTARFQ